MEDFNIDLGVLDLSGREGKKHSCELSKSGRAEMKKLGFSTGGDMKAYFFDLMKNCPEKVITVEGGYLIYDFWEDTEPPTRVPYFLELSGSFMDSPKEAAEDSRVDVRTINRWMNEGLQHFKINGRIFIPMNALDKFKKKRGRAA
ncbi:MAG TPA: helix-turn-helix domain-containing protein [Syntrophales bacterium]|nr:helix-turn-helix domain-containing protein [Syntrophales bacterium]